MLLAGEAGYVKHFAESTKLTFLLEIFQQIVSECSVFICCPDHSGRKQGQSIIVADRNACCIVVHIFFLFFFSAPTLFVNSTMPASCNSLSTPLNPILILLLLQSACGDCSAQHAQEKYLTKHQTAEVTSVWKFFTHRLYDLKMMTFVRRVNRVSAKWTTVKVHFLNNVAKWVSDSSSKILINGSGGGLIMSKQARKLYSQINVL